jgi:hypothetical protein
MGEGIVEEEENAEWGRRVQRERVKEEREREESERKE